jgi:ATP-dependent protease Clp ATPase subunit
MNKQQHTATLRYDVNTKELPFRIINDETQANVAYTYGEDDARRIVASLNACKEISTENLEENHSVKWLAEQYNAVVKQHNKLLEASKAALDWIMTQNAVPAAMRDRLYEAITEAELTK